MSREWDDGGAHVKQQLLAAVGADDSKPDGPRRKAKLLENRLASSVAGASPAKIAPP